MGAQWKALNIKEGEVFLPRCEQTFKGVAPCRSELITVLDPLQVLVLIEHNSSRFQVFLRYEGAGAGLWHSSAYAPSVKYFTPEHRIFRYGAKPFLAVTGQGNAGMGLSSKVECWLDLSAQKLSPVCSFTSDGEKTPWPKGIGVKVHGLVTSLDAQPVERAEINMSIEFTVLDNDYAIHIGERREKLAFVRGGDGVFKIDGRLSTATPQQVESFYEDLDSRFTDDDFLRFNLEGLMTVAKGKDEKARAWLSRFIRRCTDSTELRQVRTALAGLR